MRRNILITSAGRRGKLVALFQRELAARVPGAQVLAADLRPEASAACQVADGSFAVPPVEDSGYVESLLQLCSARGVGLIVPTIDPELPVLAAHRDAFAEVGVTAVVSDAQLVGICRDKRQTADWFADRGILTPRIVAPHEVSEFPLFAKPFDGSSSQGARIIRQASDFTPALLADARMMFMEYLPPADYDEFTLDMYYGRASVLRCLVPRLRIETRGGEVSKARTCRPAAFDSLRSALKHVAGARGCMTVQAFVHRRSQTVYGIEINPRFGGGYPLSFEAGANFPGWLIQEYLLGESIEFFDDWESDLTMLRYDDHVLVRGAAA